MADAHTYVQLLQFSRWCATGNVTLPPNSASLVTPDFLLESCLEEKFTFQVLLHLIQLQQGMPTLLCILINQHLEVTHLIVFLLP